VDIPVADDNIKTGLGLSALVSIMPVLVSAALQEAPAPIVIVFSPIASRLPETDRNMYTDKMKINAFFMVFCIFIGKNRYG